MIIKKLVVGTLLALSVLAFPKQASTSETPSKDENVIVLSKDNLLLLNGEINGDSAGQLILKARELDTVAPKSLKSRVLGKKDHIYLVLKTPGGLIDSGSQIAEVMTGLKRQVDTITIFSASMGFQLVQILGERLIIKSGVLMSHHARGGVEGEFGGVPGQLGSRLKFYEDSIREMDDQTVKRTKGKQTYESYIKSYDHEMWKTGTKSVAEGYADRVVTIRCDETLAGTTVHETTLLGVIPVTYELDNCPINQDPMNIKIGALPTGISRETAEAAKRDFLEKYEASMKTPRPLRF